jgi:hypothetical protein
MRPISDVRRAQALVEAGMPLLQVAAELGVSRAAVRAWRDHGFDRTVAERQVRGWVAGGLDRGRELRRNHLCDAIGRARRDPAAYAYLFGQYLGDGSIDRGKNGVYKLRVFCFSGYPGIVARVVATARAIIPGRVSGHKVPRARMVVVTTYWNHLPCLFPQHGPGRKHERFICLDDWQNRIVLGHPRPFLRGLIESDGCRTVNRVKGGEYPRYMFSNHSEEIRRLFIRTAEQLDLRWTTANARNIAISKRPDVAFLDGFIGPKW